MSTQECCLTKAVEMQMMTTATVTNAFQPLEAGLYLSQTEAMPID